MNALEELARQLWVSWGEYAKATCCGRCRRQSYCRARRGRGPWLCLACFDLSRESG